jgi:hypothetical protein
MFSKFIKYSIRNGHPTNLHRRSEIIRFKVEYEDVCGLLKKPKLKETIPSNFDSC